MLDYAWQSAIQSPHAHPTVYVLETWETRLEKG